MTQANWLKASGLELTKIIETYFRTASTIATSSGRVDDIDALLADLWPAAFRPYRLHYDSEPFAGHTLFAQEDENICDNSAKLKGFDVVKTDERTERSVSTVETPKATTSTTMNSTKSTANNVGKLSKVSKMIEEILNS